MKIVTVGWLRFCRSLRRPLRPSALRAAALFLVLLGSVCGHLGCGGGNTDTPDAPVDGAMGGDAGGDIGGTRETADDMDGGSDTPVMDMGDGSDMSAMDMGDGSDMTVMDMGDGAEGGSMTPCDPVKQDCGDGERCDLHCAGMGAAPAVVCVPNYGGTAVHGEECGSEGCKEGHACLGLSGVATCRKFCDTDADCPPMKSCQLVKIACGASGGAMTTDLKFCAL